MTGSDVVVPFAGPDPDVGRHHDARRAFFAELARHLRPAGVLLTDMVHDEPVPHQPERTERHRPKGSAAGTAGRIRWVAGHRLGRGPGRPSARSARHRPRSSSSGKTVAATQSIIPAYPKRDSARSGSPTISSRLRTRPGRHHMGGVRALPATSRDQPELDQTVKQHLEGHALQTRA